MMEQIILQLNEALVMQPGEVLKPSGTEPLRVSYGEYVPPELPTDNVFENAERIIWDTLKTQSGNQTAVYRQGLTELSVHIVPEKPKPDGFGFEDLMMYKTSRVFKFGKAEFGGLVPKEGDIFEYNETTYTVKKTKAGPCWEDIGNYNVMLRIHGSIYRG